MNNRLRNGVYKTYVLSEMDWCRSIRKPAFGAPAAQKLVTSAMLFAFGGHGNREGKFDNCGAVAVLSNGNYAVADTNNRRIQIFDIEGNHIKTIAHKVSN